MPLAYVLPDATWTAEPKGAIAALVAVMTPALVTVLEAPVTAPWRLGLASARLDAGDPWLTVKTTRRAAYDSARAALPAGLDEVVFLNGAAEVCDGTITTVFFDAGAGLRTPPLACGLLPGVLREEMLDTGQAREAVLRGEDLGRVRLWVGNSLRGLIPAVWQGTGSG